VSGPRVTAYAKPRDLNGRGPSFALREQVRLKLSPHARAACVGVVDGEALLLDGVGEVDRRAVEVRALIRSTTTSTPSRIAQLFAIEGALVEVELVDET
jgi:hypothetical protein